ncbi:MAG TPA: ABC transporter permease subunit, partial [Symbiobacteriaceae bacterium]|nr:ABC transporter permease subunit [Symbiobacteriaceae bacterium]
MQTLWSMLQWGGRQLRFLATLLIAAIAVLLLPSLIGGGMNLTQYGRTVGYHLLHLVQGQLIPPIDRITYWSPLHDVPDQVGAALPITLKLLGTAFVLSLLLGLILGAALSLLAPRWLRSPLWGAATLLYSLPDLVIGSVMQLLLVIVAILRGGTGPVRWGDGWHHFWAPALALTLVVLPYIARVTATAIDELSGQPFIRAAVARGIHPFWILWRHVGKNVLIRLCTILPVLVSLLGSSAAVLEYIMDIPGLGRGLIINASLRADDRFAGVLFLLPLLALFAVVAGLAELLQRWLDPRTGSESAVAVTERGVKNPSPLRLRALGTWLRALPATLRLGLVNLWPGLRKGLRDPVLLTGTLLVLGLVIVAVAAPWLAPHDPAQRTNVLFGPGDLIQVAPFAPSKGYPLGSDSLGRDLLSRILFGTRYALLFTLLAVPTRFLLAIPLGLVAAFRGGRWERLTRWLSAFFAAVPQVLLPLALIPTINLLYKNEVGRPLFFAVLLVALPGAPRLAASVRSQAVEVLSQPFVEGGYAVGAGSARLLFRYILPQMLPQLATMLALEVPPVLTLTAVLGYFGAFP